MSEPVITSAAPDAAPATLSEGRLIYWSVRRELWEHRAVYVAPIAIAAVALLGGIVSSFWLPRTLLAERGDGLLAIYSFIALSVMLSGLIVTLFYASSALHAERRDRSLLFWKSLPVSDRTAVLAKFAVPMVFTPAATFAIVAVTQLALLTWSTVVVLLNGLSPALLWARADLTTMWVVLPYGLVVNALWQAPLYAWLLLVSAWARRAPFLWAVAPFVMLGILEAIIGAMARAAGAGPRPSPIADFVGSRLLGGFAEAFSLDGRATAPIERIGQLDPLRTFTSPELWGGLIAAALLLAAAVWLRRRREPL